MERDLASPLPPPDRPFALRGELVLGDALEPGAVVVEGGRIASVLRDPRAGNLPSDVIDAPIVAPGLIDLQVNGGFGVEVGDDPAAYVCLAGRLPETGVTAYLPTLVSSATAVYHAAYAAFDEAKGTPGARALGFHLEGPFLAPARRGAHPLAAIEQADPTLLDGLLKGGRLAVMTLAPERSGGIDRIRRLVDHGVVVSLGHTDATCEQFTAGVDAGARMATHLYNAMSGFGHRAPGAVGAALVDPRVTVGLIADGIHSHPASLRLAVQAKGVERVALVTDAMAAAGMPPGTYGLGGQTVTVDASGARLADGTLAGTVLTLDEAVRNAVRWTGVTAAQAIRMASEVPAALLGQTDLGRIARGCAADLVLFDPDLTVRGTLIGGRFAYRAAPEA